MNNELYILNEDISYLLYNADYKILKLNKRNYKLHNLILDFCSKNDLLLYNNLININNLSNYDLTNKTDFNFIIFCTDPVKFSNRLFKLILKTYSKYVSLMKTLRNNEIILSVDSDRVVYFNTLFNTNDNIFTKFEYNICSIYDHNIKILPDIIVLFFISHKIYHPDNYLTIINDTSNSDIKKKYDILFNRIIKNDKLSINNTFTVNKLKTKIFKSIFSELNTLSIDIILLGDIAYSYLKTGSIVDFYKELEIICKYNKGIMNMFLSLIKNVLSKLKIKYKCLKYISSDTYIYGDFRLKRYNIFIILDNNEKISLFTIYNSTNYELIPIVDNYSKYILIPSKYVLIRFFLLNYLSLRIYTELNKSSFDYILKVIYLTNELDLSKKKTIYYTGIFKDEKSDKFALGMFNIRPTLEEFNSNF